MERYDYWEAMETDIREWVDWNIDRKKWIDDRARLEDYLNNTLWTDDSVTGNGSGSYTFNTWQAEENLCHNTDLLEEALDYYGQYWDTNILEKGAEWCDVTIRCYLLSQVIGEILDDLEEKGFFEEEEAEEE